MPGFFNKIQKWKMIVTRDFRKIKKEVDVKKKQKKFYTLISLTDEDGLKEAGVPVSPWTLRKWRREGRYPELFTKVGKRVFLVLENWQKLVQKGIGK